MGGCSETLLPRSIKVEDYVIRSRKTKLTLAPCRLNQKKQGPWARLLKKAFSSIFTPCGRDAAWSEQQNKAYKMTFLLLRLHVPELINAEAVSPNLRGLSSYHGFSYYFYVISFLRSSSSWLSDRIFSTGKGKRHSFPALRPSS